MKNLFAVTTLTFPMGYNSSFSCIAPISTTRTAATNANTKLWMGYVPDGLTATEYERIKKADQKKIGKDLGKLGPRGFQSRSLQAWQEAMEQGKDGHKFAPIGYKEAVRNGKLKMTDIPYMVRGGHWDNSDVKGAKRIKWTKKDKEYASGGYRKEQSVSILGSGPGLDWTGKGHKVDGPKKVYPGFF